MNHAKILDCTLRDGAYIIDKKFGENNIQGIIKGLIDTKIDIIEIGFLEDEGMEEGKTVYLNADQAKKYTHYRSDNVEYTVLADYSRYKIDNLEENPGDSFHSVRACFFKDEKEKVLGFCEKIKEKGYKLYIQPVDILSYEDEEIIELVKKMNIIEPDCFSIVDTFGSMYEEDLLRVYSIISHNLISSCQIGFHSHNNLQMSSALAQSFLKMSFGKRNVIIDSTICGMGRGAGNTPTELIVQYMVSKLNYSYNMDALLDIIDEYMDNIRTRCNWGYSTSYFIAGSYSAHVNNIAYLKQKSTIASKDIRYILNKIGSQARKKYEYDLLEDTYVKHLQSNIDDSFNIMELTKYLKEKNVVMILPGNSVSRNIERIEKYIVEKNATVIVVNYINQEIKADYLYFNNINRYRKCLGDNELVNYKKIIVSNIKQIGEENETIISFNRLIKCGWEYMDNSAIMLLRLLDIVQPISIGIAGFDGYSNKMTDTPNYANEQLELSNIYDNYESINREIESMYHDYLTTRKYNIPINFITESRFKVD